MRWLGLALLGILIAAAVSVAASRLASQQIGLASEPISAGDALAPADQAKPRHSQPRSQRSKNGRGVPQPTTPVPQPTPTPAPEPTTVEPTPSPPTESPPAGHGGEQDSGHSGEGADD